jgi:hypothetical protein
MGFVENLFLLFWGAGSKYKHYLRIEPSEYVGFPYAGWWKEREGKGRGRISLSTPA